MGRFLEVVWRDFSVGRFVGVGEKLKNSVGHVRDLPREIDTIYEYSVQFSAPIGKFAWAQNTHVCDPGITTLS